MTDAYRGPDTSEAVEAALEEADWKVSKHGYSIVAETAIAANNAELERLGYAVVKVGEVPPWMTHHTNLCAIDGAMRPKPWEDCKEHDVLPLYRLSPVLEEE